MSTSTTAAGNGRVHAAGGRVAPGPRGAPFLGSLPEIKRNALKFWLDARREYGDIVRATLGPYEAHMVVDPEGVQQVLQKNYKNYKRGWMYEPFKMFFGDGLLTIDGDLWRRRRRIAQPSLARKAVQERVPVMTEVIRTTMQRWEAQAERGEALDIVPDLMRTSQSVVGQTLLSVDMGEEQETLKHALPFGLEAMSAKIFAGPFGGLIPEWVPIPHHRRIARAHRAFDSLLLPMIAEHRQRGDMGDYVSVLISARDEETGEALTDAEIYDEIMNVFLAGYETTGTGMAWTLYALAMHPEIRRRLEAEVDEVLGDRAPTLEDLEKLRYTRMVVQESLRVYPPIWGYPREAIEDDEVCGYRIPARSAVMICPFVSHHHPDLWENPEAFDPERFAPEQEERRTRFTYLPFGNGPRQCIGLYSAQQQIELMTAMVTQRFRLHPVPGHPVDYGALLSLHPLHGILVTLHPRRGAERPARPAARARQTETTEAAPVEPAACPYQQAESSGAEEDAPEGEEATIP